MTTVERNGLGADLDKWQETQRKAAVKYAEKRRAAVVVSREGGKVRVRREPVKKVSDKRAVEDRIYLRLRAVFLVANPDCARCGRLATEIQHMAGRIGALFLDVTKWIGLCHDCHVWVTAHPREAVEQGYALRRVA